MLLPGAAASAASAPQVELVIPTLLPDEVRVAVADGACSAAKAA